MPTFIMLSTLTDDGAETVKENPDRIRQVREELERQFGIRVVAQYAVLGPYDFVNIIEAPDIETAARVSAEMAARGSVKIQTLAAIPVDEFIARLKG
ncbi:MAG TPA: GYD domain-containing protein [Dehalococcoidia bacterium]|nr:GYD domain-containing protein [Dehalococcoidia bacterium]